MSNEEMTIRDIAMNWYNFNTVDIIADFGDFYEVVGTINDKITEISISKEYV